MSAALPVDIPGEEVADLLDDLAVIYQVLHSVVYKKKIITNSAPNEEFSRLSNISHC